MIDTITLIDGSELECYPIAHQPDTIQADTLSLDTTGEYLRIGSKPVATTEDYKAERAKAERLFYEHVNLFLANADCILSDSRLFLAPVGIVNGLAYTGTSGFNHPTLGVYVEWWLHHKDASIDAKGRPIWFISGSPLSGANACSTVDRNGKTHKALLNGNFMSVWRSFMEVNTRYTVAKQRYFAYSLQEVVDLLEGSTDHQQIFKAHLRLEKAKYDNLVSNLKLALKQARELSLEYRSKIQQLLFNEYREAAEAYYRQCLNMQSIARLSCEYFLEQRIDLRKQLRRGAIDNVSYQKTLTPLRKKADEAKYQCWHYEREGLTEVFGDDSDYFNFDTIEFLILNTKETSIFLTD